MWEILNTYVLIMATVVYPRYVRCIGKSTVFRDIDMGAGRDTKTRELFKAHRGVMVLESCRILLTYTNCVRGRLVGMRVGWWVDWWIG